MSDRKRAREAEKPKNSNERSILHFFGAKQPKTSECVDINEPIGENSRGETVNIDIADEGSEKRPERQFQSSWLSSFPWLQYDREKKLMTCQLCLKVKKNNALTVGSSNFRTSTLNRHAECKDHIAAVQSTNLKTDFVRAVNKVMSDKDEAITVVLKVVYWMSKENIAMHKYGSLIELLTDLKCPNIEHLQHADNATYKSETTANDMLESLATVIRKKIDSNLLQSPFISVFADESTDIGMQKKLVVFARVTNPDTFESSTHYLENVKVSNGTGKVVSEAILECLNKREVLVSKVMGFGSDGAKAMTGTGEGVTGHLLRVNPMLLNYHCIAHRLALVSSQAANTVPYMKEYQEILTGIFYFFKASANRCEKLSTIQALLNEPHLKIREVHEVRWMSIYKAVETVYRSLDSLITLFKTETDAKAKGYCNKIANSASNSTTYLLMDILPIITELCLMFQKSNLDVSMVQVSVEQCITDLTAKNSGGSQSTDLTYLGQLQDHLRPEENKLVFKANHYISKGQRKIDNIKDAFIDSLIKKLHERFPNRDSNIIYAFGCLAMRPLSFLSKVELSDWGNDKLEILLNHFGEEQVHRHQEQETTAQPVIDKDATRVEWKKVKPLVVNAGYPRDKMSDLWRLLSTHHKEDFPNLQKLAALAFTAPIHTADCERGFSSQNLIKTSSRNRLCPESVDDLITVCREGDTLSNFNFQAALNHWKAKKNRRLFAC